MNIPILYEDNHLLIVEKPVNMPVQEDSSRDPDLLNALKDFIKVRDDKPGNVYLALVHRLDRPVGGAIVYAKTSKAASRLANELRLRQVERQYLAIVRGHFDHPSDTLVDYLVKDPSRNHSTVATKQTPKSQKAILNYEVLEQTKELSLVKAELQTGRSHQIRVQLEHHAGPIWGDQRYGYGINQPGQQIALWAYQLSFKHPTRDEIITVSCLPDTTDYPWNQFNHYPKI